MRKIAFRTCMVTVLIGLLSVGAAPVLAASDIGKPGATPDRIVLNPAPNASTGQIITWRTSLKVKAGSVQLRVGNGKVRTVKQRTTATTSPSKSVYRARHHSATVTTLKAGIAYRYRVGSSSGWSGWRTFRTAANTTDWTLLSFGDTQLGSKSWLATMFDRAFTKAPSASAIIQLGDIVEDPRNDKEWGTLLESFRGRLGRINLAVTPGNHDQCLLKRCTRPSSRAFQAHFEFARNRVKSQQQDWYYSDINNVRIISLNSFKALSPQRTFLDTALKSSTKTWNIVIFHAPVFSGAPGRSNTAMRKSWLPILKKYDVDLVLNGHDHQYARGSLVGEPDGTQYVVQVTSPKYYGASADSSNDWTKNGAVRTVKASQVSTYGVIDFGADVLSYRTVVATKGKHPSTSTHIGGVLDSFRITKAVDGTKTVD